MPNHPYLRIRLSVLTTLALIACNSASTPTIRWPAPLSDPLPARAGTQRVTPDWLLANLPKRSAGDIPIAWMPDGASLLAVMRGATSGSSSVLELFDVATGLRRTLGAGDQPVVGPDGRIAFLRSVRDTAQIWIMNADGTEARQVTRIAGGIRGYPGYNFGYAWSPDGKSLAVGYQPYIPGWAREVDASKGDSTKSSAIEGAAVVTPPVDGELWLYDVATVAGRKLSSGAYRLAGITWHPDGSEIVYATGHAGMDYGEIGDRYTLMATRVADGATRTVAWPRGMQQSLSPAISPDGRRVAFTYDADHEVYDYLTSISLADLTGPGGDSAKITRLTYDARLAAPVWAPDGGRLYARRTYGAYRQINAVDASTGAVTQLTRGPMDIGHFALSRDGSKLAWSGTDVHGRSIIRTGASDGSGVRDILLTSPYPDSLELSEAREIEWPARGDRLPMRGILVYPLGYTKGTKYPLVVDIHGGGGGSRIYMMGGILVETPLEWQMWAAKGYAVLVPDYRVTSSYGSAPIKRMQETQTWNADLDDIMGGVDYVVAQGIADKDRMAVFGHSAGAFRGNWLAVTTHEFKAIVTHDGWADSFLESGVNPGATRNWIYKGTPVTAPENYMKNSAIYHTKGATTPTLFIQGNPRLGGADPYSSVRFLYNALKEQGVDTKYVYYPDEGHVTAKPANKRDQLMRTLDWIDSRVGLRTAAKD